MNIGDVVERKDGYPLRSRCEVYLDAVVVALPPMVLVSRETDMMWQSTVEEGDFKVVGSVSPAHLQRCQRRLEEPTTATASKSAMDQQVGGDHYKLGGIQPFALSQANLHDSCTHAIQKYLTRFEAKDGIRGLQKAHHICGIRYEMIQEYGAPRAPNTPRIFIDDYIRSNKCSDVAADAIRAMERWFNTSVKAPQSAYHDGVRNLIRLVAQTHYPETYIEEEFL